MTEISTYSAEIFYELPINFKCMLPVQTKGYSLEMIDNDICIVFKSTGKDANFEVLWYCLYKLIDVRSQEKLSFISTGHSVVSKCLIQVKQNSILFLTFIMQIRSRACLQKLYTLYYLISSCQLDCIELKKPIVELATW